MKTGRKLRGNIFIHRYIHWDICLEPTLGLNTNSLLSLAIFLEIELVMIIKGWGNAELSYLSDC